MIKKHICEHCGLDTDNAPDNANEYGVYEFICEICVYEIDEQMCEPPDFSD